MAPGKVLAFVETYEKDGSKVLSTIIYDHQNVVPDMKLVPRTVFYLFKSVRNISALEDADQEEESKAAY